MFHFVSAGAKEEGLGCGIPEWLSDTTWRQCQYMRQHMEPFAALCDSLSSSSRQWREFRDTGELYDLLSKPYTSLDLMLEKGNRDLIDR